MVEKILVPIDGSKQADSALKKALEIAKEENAKVTILHVCERRPIPVAPYQASEYPNPWLMGRPLSAWEGIPHNYPLWATQFDDELYQHNKDVFKEAKEIADNTAPEVEKDLVIKLGKPAETILDISKSGNYDLIIMGSTGLGDVGKFLLGV